MHNKHLIGTLEIHVMALKYHKTHLLMLIWLNAHDMASSRTSLWKLFSINSISIWEDVKVVRTMSNLERSSSSSGGLKLCCAWVANNSQWPRYFYVAWSLAQYKCVRYNAAIYSLLWFNVTNSTVSCINLCQINLSWNDNGICLQLCCEWRRLQEYSFWMFHQSDWPLNIKTC